MSVILTTLSEVRFGSNSKLNVASVHIMFGSNSKLNVALVHIIFGSNSKLNVASLHTFKQTSYKQHHPQIPLKTFLETALF